MKKTVLVQGLVAAAAAALLISCGGGGGAPYPDGGTGGGTGGGTPTSVPGGGTATPTSSPTPIPPTISLNVLNAQDTPSLRLSAAETAKARVQLLNGAGNPVADTPVTFSGNQIKLPITGGLTDASGYVTLEFSAATSGFAGLGVITANATVEGEALSTSKTVQFSSQPAVPVDPVTLANSILLADVNPADKSIVIKGAGANGRSETASIRFRVLDSQGNPVKDVPVNFTANPSAVVDVTIPTAKTDSNGYVMTTVSSKNVASTVVVKAMVPGTTLESQSDQLTVTTGVAVAGAFDLSAAKFNLDGLLSGDTTTLTARLSDTNGNPVADGVAVVFTTDAGAVGSSSRGGCVIASGQCSVPFFVQAPRGTGLATVLASVNTGNTSFSQSVQLNMASAVTLPIITPTTVNVGNTCEALANITLDDGAGRALAAGSTIAVAPTINSNFDVSVVTGSPVLDSRNLQPTTTRLKFVTGKATPPDAGCDVSTPGNNTANASEVVEMTITTPGGTVFTRDINVSYLRKP